MNLNSLLKENKLYVQDDIIEEIERLYEEYKFLDVSKEDYYNFIINSIRKNKNNIID